MPLALVASEITQSELIASITQQSCAFAFDRTLGHPFSAVEIARLTHQYLTLDTKLGENLTNQFNLKQ